MSGTIFCWCGLLLEMKFGGYVNCPRHGLNPVKPEPHQKKGKYSGPSKTPYGSYEER